MGILIWDETPQSLFLAMQNCSLQARHWSQQQAEGQSRTCSVSNDSENKQTQEGQTHRLQRQHNRLTFSTFFLQPTTSPDVNAGKEINERWISASGQAFSYWLLKLPCVTECRDEQENKQSVSNQLFQLQYQPGKYQQLHFQIVLRKKKRVEERKSLKNIPLQVQIGYNFSEKALGNGFI